MPTAEDIRAAETRDVLVLARACLAMKRVALWQASAAAQRAGSARAVLDGGFEPETRWEAEVRAAVDALPELDATRDALDDELARWFARGLRVTTVLDDDYPLNLRFVWDRPPFLFYRGELRRDDAYSLAVVGTREPSDEGRRRASRMSRLLCEHDMIVLSGLARGIDTEAHQAALAAGGRTIAVLGHGFDHMYPKENAALAEAIAETGAVVSQFFPDTPPTRKTFPLRNAVTSGIAQGTCVIEASATSGARLQARLAIEHGKHAFLLRSLVEQHEWAREFATKDRAVVITDVDDVLPYLHRPDELADEWKRDPRGILRRIAEPPEYVQQRFGTVAARGQQQLSL